MVVLRCAKVSVLAARATLSHYFFRSIQGTPRISLLVTLYPFKLKTLINKLERTLKVNAKLPGENTKVVKFCEIRR